MLRSLRLYGLARSNVVVRVSMQQTASITSSSLASWKQQIMYVLSTSRATPARCHCLSTIVHKDCRLATPMPNDDILINNTRRIVHITFVIDMICSTFLLITPTNSTNLFELHFTFSTTFDKLTRMLFNDALACIELRQRLSQCVSHCRYLLSCWLTMRMR